MRETNVSFALNSREKLSKSEVHDQSLNLFDIYLK